MSRRRDDDRYRDYDDRDSGVAYTIATAIRWIGIVIVVVIVAYVVLRITGTIEGIIFSSPQPSSDGVTRG